MTTVEEPSIEVLLQAQEWQDARDDGVRTGLAAHPPELSPVWFYDERGSNLFDAITRLPEYYQTRAERRLLQEHGDDLAALRAMRAPLNAQRADGG